jgi:hypothetical protein
MPRVFLALAALGLALAMRPTLVTATCTMTCRQDTARCVSTRCTGLRGTQRRACLDTCKGIGGCTRIGTLAWVQSTCTEHGYRQQLQIRRGNCDPITVLDFPGLLRGIPCAEIGMTRFGFASEPVTGSFHRMGVSPSGRHVVFEVTDDFSLLNKNRLVPPEQPEGIFDVRADGRGLRRLGPPSRDASFGFQVDPTSRFGTRVGLWTPLSFRPDGGAVVLTDLGPGPGGEEAIQIFTLNLTSGQRTQLTHLPYEPEHPQGLVSLQKGTCCPVFLTDGKISFLSYVDIDGLNPEGRQVEFVMNADGSGLKRVPIPVAIDGSRAVPIFEITRSGARRRATTLSIPGTPVNAEAGDTISEIFFFDDMALVQLTSFQRTDTTTPHLTSNGQRVIFAASADPFGTNPSGTCQLFSIGTTGSGLRQLTFFSQPEHSVSGCLQITPPGCRILPYGIEPSTGTLVFYSSCDPFGTNPYGDQLFAISSDGTRLRQLTHARGLFTEADGTVSTENIGPIGHSPIVGQ